MTSSILLFRHFFPRYVHKKVQLQTTPSLGETKRGLTSDGETFKPLNYVHYRQEQKCPEY